MIPILLSADDVLRAAWLLLDAGQAHMPVRVAVDVDGFKVKVANYAWSSPMGHPEDRS